MNVFIMRTAETNGPRLFSSCRQIKTEIYIVVIYVL